MTNKLKKFVARSSILICMSIGVPANATTVTSDVFTNGESYEFNEGNLSGGPENTFLPNSPSGTRNFSSGSVGVEYDPAGAVLGYELVSGTTLGTNGGWTAGRDGYVLTFGNPSEMKFTFNTPVSAVGAFVNYETSSINLGSAVMEIFDTSGGLLETFDIVAGAPINTTGGTQNQGGFRGFERATADIGALVFSSQTGNLVLDDLTLSTHVVPLPAGLPLLLSSIGALGLMRHKRKVA